MGLGYNDRENKPEMYIDDTAEENIFNLVDQRNKSNQ